MTTYRKKSSTFRNRSQSATKFEQLSPELIFDIFDYFTGNEICRSFWNLNNKLNQFVHNAHNVHIDLSRATTKFFQTFRQIFFKENIVSLVLFYENIGILEEFSNSTNENRLRSLSLLDVPLNEFETRIPNILSPLKNQLVHLHVRFSSMKFTGAGDVAAQSFMYLLTELPLLTSLALEYSKGIDLITYMPSSVVNNTILNLTISIRDSYRLIPLLYRFQKLKILSINHDFVRMTKRAAPPPEIINYRTQIREKTSMELPVKLRHIKIYKCFIVSVTEVERFLQLLMSPSLLTVSFFDCTRHEVRHPIPRRQPPFLDGTQWHDLLKRYLPSTMKRFYIEYEDVDNTMSRTNPLRVEKDFIQYSGGNTSWKLYFAYDKDTRQMSFNIILI